MKILAVDDDSFILELLTIMAGRAGFTDITTASSGEKAWEILNEGDVVFDCLLLDISMPGMDGIELCALTHALPAYHKTPIIMLTAMTEKEYIDRAFRAGATDYVNKPFDIIELHARLRMAKELVIARKMSVVDITKAPDLKINNRHQDSFGIFDEIQIEGIKDLISYTALKNYLTQLSHAGMAGSQVLAIKINRINAIFERASKQEFTYALTEAADAISKAIRIYGYMMAYVGNGAFMVVMSKATLEPSGALETEIQNILDERDTEYDSGDPLDIEVSVGNPLRPNTSMAQGTRNTFDRAIARAENRGQNKSRKSNAPNIRLIGGRYNNQ